MTDKTNDLAVMQVERALLQAEPSSALRSVIRSLLTQGRTRVEVADLLERFREKNDLSDEVDDIVLDQLAILDGLASSTAIRALLPPPCVAPHLSRS